MLIEIAVKQNVRRLRGFLVFLRSRSSGRAIMSRQYSGSLKSLRISNMSRASAKVMSRSVRPRSA